MTMRCYGILSRHCRLARGSQLPFIIRTVINSGYHFTVYLNFTPFPNKPWDLRVCSTNLITSNFSFSRSVFHPLENFLPFSLNLKLSSASSFNLKESKMCRSGKGQGVGKANFETLYCFNPLTLSQTISDPSKLKEFTDNNFIFDENGGKFPKRV